MRSSARGAALLLAFAFTLGCKSKQERDGSRATATSSGGDAAPSLDAARQPTSELAAAAIRTFSAAVAGDDLAAAREVLRVPEELSDEDVEGFLAQLMGDGHLSAEGLAAVVELEFGPASERFGDAAEAVARNAEIPLDAAWAFGGPEASALLVWEGSRFRVVAVANLTSLIAEETP